MTTRDEIERLVADMVKRYGITPVRPEDRTELIEVVRRRLNSMADEYSDEFLRAPRRMLADYIAIDRALADLRAMLGKNIDAAHAAGRAAIVAESQNVGHGHVFPRPDGVLARCGGPGLCAECSRDAARKAAEERGA